MSCETNCGQPMIESSLGCYTPHGSSASVTIDIYRTFMPDPTTPGKTILTETRYVKPTATGPMPFVPDFVAGDLLAIGACPLAQVVASANATGDLEDACYKLPDDSIVPVKIIVEVDPTTGALSVLAFSVPTLQPIVGFDQANLVACPLPAPCATPTNTGVNGNW